MNMTPEKPPLTDALARTESPWFRLWHEFLYLPYHMVMTLGFSLRMQGQDNMPQTGRAQVPIIPVGIAGAYDAWPIWRGYPVPAPLFLPAGPGTISVALGQPLDGRRYAEMPRDQALQQLFDKMRAEQERAEKLRRR